MNSNGDKPVRYLTVSDLYNLNFTVTGGDTFVRDIHLLEAAAQRPRLVVFGVEQFPTLVDKAAALMHSLAARHLFADGNKRTASRAAAYFLELNGCTISWPEAELQRFLLDVAQSKHDVEAVGEWLHPYVQCP